MKSFITKLSSRKFIITVLADVVAIIGTTCADDAAVKLGCIIAGTLLSIAYLYVEGKCDWSDIKSGADTIIDAIEDYVDGLPVEVELKTSEPVLTTTTGSSDGKVTDEDSTIN